jgi:hypothetical protein
LETNRVTYKALSDYPGVEGMELAMVTTVGRDPESNQRTIATLFARATELNLTPLAWEVGFFIHRDLLRVHGRKLEGEPWTRMESMWGCAVKTVGLQDTIALIAHGTFKGTVGPHRLLAKEV